MKIWLDAQLSPFLANWIKEEYQIETIPLRDVGLRDSTDKEIFFSARKDGAVIMSKDSDFIDLVTSFGTPPQILLITCGNTSNEKLKIILKNTLAKAIILITAGETIVEISDII